MTRRAPPGSRLGEIARLGEVFLEAAARVAAQVPGLRIIVPAATPACAEALRQLLAELDRHCVESPEALRDTPHAMTAQGLMSGRALQFDKQDQKRLDQDWMTGFDNRDRLAQLQEQIKAQTQAWQSLRAPPRSRAMIF